MFVSLQGTKPDFHHAMPGDKSKEFYENFLQMLKNAYKPDKVKGTSLDLHFIIIKFKLCEIIQLLQVYIGIIF